MLSIINKLNISVKFYSCGVLFYLNQYYILIKWTLEKCLLLELIKFICCTAIFHSVCLYILKLLTLFSLIFFGLFSDKLRSKNFLGHPNKVTGYTQYAENKHIHESHCLVWMPVLLIILSVTDCLNKQKYRLRAFPNWFS